MDYIKKEMSRLVPILLIIFIVFSPIDLRWGVLIMGVFLLCEHRYMYNRWDIKDILGHETFGLLLTLIGLFFFKWYWSMIMVSIVYFGFGTWRWKPKLSPWKYALKKLGVKNG